MFGSSLTNIHQHHSGIIRAHKHALADGIVRQRCDPRVAWRTRVQGVGAEIVYTNMLVTATADHDVLFRINQNGGHPVAMR